MRRTLNSVPFARYSRALVQVLRVDIHSGKLMFTWTKGRDIFESEVRQDTGACASWRMLVPS